MRNSTIEIEPVTGYVGAEIQNIDLSRPHDNNIYREIRQALCDHGVIFFRDQKLTSQQYLAFAKHFGELTVSPIMPLVEGFPQIAEVRKEAEQRDNIGGDWHTDQAYRKRPIMGTMLLARELPSRGGDTLFTNMAAAYAFLSDGLKKTLEGLRAVHSQDFLMATSRAQAGDMNVAKMQLKETEAAHPVVTTHPETGRKILYVNPGYTSHFEGWTRRESEPLLNFLYQHALTPEFGCRFHWREGSLAFWDNRQTWHYAANDYHGERRLMHRIMVQPPAL